MIIRKGIFWKNNLNIHLFVQEIERSTFTVGDGGNVGSERKLETQVINNTTHIFYIYMNSFINAVVSPGGAGGRAIMGAITIILYISLPSTPR